jgi:iron(II)-dependent oxidoreductase
MVEELITELRRARSRTRSLADDLAGGREFGPKLAIVNPPRWEVGHVAWFQEYWCLRGSSEDRPSILPNADRLYNSATVPHDARWDSVRLAVRRFEP